MPQQDNLIETLRYTARQDNFDMRSAIQLILVALANQNESIEEFRRVVEGNNDEHQEFRAALSELRTQAKWIDRAASAAISALVSIGLGFLLRHQ